MSVQQQANLDMSLPDPSGVLSKKLIYYPYLYSQWHASYRPFIGKKRRVNVALMTSLLKEENSFLSSKFDLEKYQHQGGLSPEKKFSLQQASASSHEFLRKHFIYRLRSWIVPEIININSIPLYLPYILYQKTNLSFGIYECMSQRHDKLENYPELMTLTSKEE